MRPPRIRRLALRLGRVPPKRAAAALTVACAAVAATGAAAIAGDHAAPSRASAVAAAALTRDETLALKISHVRVIATRWGLMVQVQTKGDFRAHFGQGNLTNARVGVLLWPKGRRKAKAKPAVLAEFARGTLPPRLVRSRVKGVAAVMNDHPAFTFFLTGYDARKLRKIQVKTFAAATSARRRAVGPRGAQHQTLSDFISGLPTDEVGLSLHFTSAAGDCDKLLRLIAEAEDAAARIPNLQERLFDERGAERMIAEIDKARSIYAEHCHLLKLVTFGSGLTATIILGDAYPADTEYWWAQLGAGGASRLGAGGARPRTAVVAAAVQRTFTAPVAGRITKVTIKGYAVKGDRTGPGGSQPIRFQVLRPTAGGGVKVVTTTEAFTLPGSPGTYSFDFSHLRFRVRVKPGDYVSLATRGGQFAVFGHVPGSVTYSETGPNQNQGTRYDSGVAHPDTELLMQVTEKSGR